MTSPTYDLVGIKQSFDLFSLVEKDTQLHHKGNGPRGREFCGPCPFCARNGGAIRDGFTVQPESKPWPTWFCRKCTGPGSFTVIDYIARRENLNPKVGHDLTEIVRIITGGNPPTIANSERSIVQPAKPAAVAPAKAWQIAAMEYIEAAERNLWGKGGEKALAYLRAVRGLNDKTIHRFRLGYNPTERFEDAARWGEPAGNNRPVFLAAGIVIPWITRGEVWAISIRRRKDSAGREPKPKYLKLRGSRAAIYNGDDLPGAETAIFTEGELDAATAWQELGDVMGVATFGAAGTIPDLATFGPYLIGIRQFLITYDPDKAGEQGARKFSDLIPTARQVRLPEGMDVNAFHTLGGNLYQLVEPYLPPVPASIHDLVAELGATMTELELELKR